ncbi:MAG: hypothetical protein RIS35_2011, partial [Pseudomonadota bacterium]
MTARTVTPPQPRHFAAWPRRMPRNVPPLETTLWDNLEVSARRHPDKAAIVFFGQSVSYARLRDDATRLAGWLQREAGVRAGDRVLLMMQNSPQFVIASYAILRADAVVVPVNPMSRADELAHYIADPEAKVAICAADLVAHIEAGDAQVDASRRLQRLLVARYADCIPADLHPDERGPDAWRDWLDADPPLPSTATRWSDALAAGHTPGPPTAAPDDLVALCYTSGTTGKPKGCMHTHRTIGHNTVCGALWQYGTSADVTLGVVPMFHITG